MNLTTFEQLENQPTKTLLLKVMKVENAAADHGKVVPWLNEVIASSFVNEKAWRKLLHRASEVYTG